MIKTNYVAAKKRRWFKKGVPAFTYIFMRDEKTTYTKMRNMLLRHVGEIVYLHMIDCTIRVAKKYKYMSDVISEKKCTAFGMNIYKGDFINITLING